MLLKTAAKPMSAADDWHLALRTAKPLFNDLQRLYKKLPPTCCRCQAPGKCCTYIPQMTLIEALQWIDILQGQSPEHRVDTLKKFLTFYLTNPVQHAGCPFLNGNTCGIYEFRPFACRAYGLWSRQIGNARTENSRLERRGLLKMWQGLGLQLPAAKVIFEMDYCEQVECLTVPAISDGALIAVLEKIYLLDRRLPEQRKRFEIVYHSDFSFWMTSLILGARKAVLMKFAIVKEIVTRGSSERLPQMLAKVTPGALEFS